MGALFSRAMEYPRRRTHNLLFVKPQICVKFWLGQKRFNASDKPNARPLCSRLVGIPEFNSFFELSINSNIISADLLAVTPNLVSQNYVPV